jgi:ribose transport system substrate-binding protein
MAGDSSKRGRSTFRIGSVLVLAIVIAGGSYFYMQWEQGAYRKRVKVAIVTWTQDSFWDPTERGASDAARDLGVELTFLKSNPDVESQNKNIRDVLAGGVDGLAISPNDPQAQQAIINDAAGKAVVITFDSDAPNTRRRGFVGSDDYAAGQIAADEVRSAIPQGGKVMICVGSIDMSNGRDRRQGLIDNLLDRPFKHGNHADPIDADLKGKNYEVVATLIDHHDIDSVARQVTAAIAANPDVKCIVGLFSYDGHEIVKGIDAAGKKDQIKVIGFDESPEEQADVLSGAIYSSILQNQYHCGYETVRTLADTCRGVAQNGPSGPWLVALPVIVMRKDNLQSLRDSHMVRVVEVQH